MRVREKVLWKTFFFGTKTSKTDKKIFADPQAEAHKKQRQKRSERKPLSHLAYSSRLRSFVKTKKKAIRESREWIRPFESINKTSLAISH